MNRTHLKIGLNKLTKSLAISGYEWELDIVNTIQELAGSAGERIGDNLVYKFGNGKTKIFISAHMDEVGFFISNLESNYVRIMPIGDIDVEDVIGKRLILQTNGRKLLSNTIKSAKSFSNIKVYGFDLVSLGDVGTFEKKIQIKDAVIFSPSLDNKVGCLVLLELMKIIKISMSNSTIIFCFASREEIGVNGLMSAVRQYNPDICIDIDSAYAMPLIMKKRNNWNIPIIGNGPAIQLMGNGFIISGTKRKFIESICNDNNIPFQYEIPDGESGGTNAKTLLSAGYETMQINIPVANQHTAKSKASLKDIEVTIELLTMLLQTLDKIDV